MNVSYDDLILLDLHYKWPVVWSIKLFDFIVFVHK